MLVVCVRVGLLGEMDSESIGHRIGDRDDEDAAEHRDDRLRARIQPDDQADRGDNA